MQRDQQLIAREIVQRVPFLTAGQLFWLDRVMRVFESEHRFEVIESDLFDKNTVVNFGDALRIHHSFSAEPFSKDKFEFVLEQVLALSGRKASLAPKGNRGHDIEIEGTKISLKTQADRSIRVDKIWISKFMELGKGAWSDDPKDLHRLRSMYLQHLKNYDRMFSLRALRRAPSWFYELVEIPKQLLLAAKMASWRCSIRVNNSLNRDIATFGHVREK